MKCVPVIYTILVLIACVFCDDSQDAALNNLLNADNLSNLPGIDGLDVSQLNASLPSLEDAERLFKEKCLKNADIAAYEHASRAKDEVKECIMSLVNVTVLQEEMEKAKPTGDLDIVFRKYCRKSPQLLDCVSNFTAATEPCLDEPEKESKHIVQNITESLVKFICFKEGDRIALFIAEGGPECLSSHQEDIQQCVNQTLSKHIPSKTPSINDLPALILGREECKDIRALQNCVVRKLEACKEPTPANIVESMFNFIYKVTPCGRLRSSDPESTSLTGQASRSNTLATDAFVLAISLVSLAATRYL